MKKLHTQMVSLWHDQIGAALSEETTLIVCLVVTCIALWKIFGRTIVAIIGPE
jgi:hypothetical protein